MKQVLLLCLVVLCSAAFTGCSDDSDDDNNNPTNPGNSNGSISAKVNGESWSATTVQGTWTNNVLGLGGAQIQGAENRQINIAGMVASTGTYQLGGFSGITATYSIGSGSSVESHIGMSGTLKVDQLSSSGAKGTFNFSTNDGFSITEGSFDVKFK